MWEQLIGWAQLLWNAGKDVRELQDDVETLHADLEKAYELIQVLATQNELLRRDVEQAHRDLQGEREKRADELEKIELRLRLQMSEELRRLPPANNSNED